MRRFRLLFVAIALLLAVPVGLLLQRAIASVALERNTRQQAVAERIFDEMERTLSEWLAAEEERPFGEYSAEYLPQVQEGGAGGRSPLAAPPSLPFVVGYFQIDPDGSLHTPLREPAAAAAALVSQLDRTVVPYLRGTADAAPARGRTAPAPQAPGTTVTVRNEPQAYGNMEAPASSGAASVFDALRALNKGAEQRAGRQAKTALDYAFLNAPQMQEAPLAAAKSKREDRDALAAREQTAPTPTAAPARLAIAPMVGRLLDANHLLLHRTVVREARVYRQGLLLDLDRLGDWLRSRALGGTDIEPHAAVTFLGALAAAPAPASAAAFTYQHRFAEPFADLSARLALTPLPGVGSANYVYALCAVVVVAGGLGLLALYRMVSVTVAYAERRSNFVAAVSHELKTPLTAIRMYGEMLRDGIVPAEAKRVEYYRHITAESERLTRLINNVLEFSRLEKGMRQIPLATASLGPVVMEAVELLRPHAEREGFALDCAVEASLPAVRCERDAVLQIIFNLVDNAVKYARAREPRRISLVCRRAGPAVDLAVRDSGAGVAPQQLRRLFEPFYRGEGELTRRSAGSGLGLALVRGLAAQMGARARAGNPPDGGFEVVISFPVPG